MKSVIKKWWFWLILSLTIIIIVTLILFNNNSDYYKGVGTAGISKGEFGEIRTGMSQFEVHGIIDKYDEWDNDEVYEKCCEKISDSYENHKYTYQYKYYGEKSGYVIITYEADYSKTTFGVIPEVVKKESFDLK